MSGPGDDDDGEGKPGGTGGPGGPGGPGGTWPPDAEYAVPTGAPDVYDPGYVPPPADPAHDDAHALEGPPGALYPGPGASTGSALDGADSTAGVPAGSTSGVIAAPYPPSPSSGIAVAGDDPLLPPELGADGALQDAVGAPSAKARRRAKTEPRRDGDDDDGLGPPRNRRTMIIATSSIVVGLGVATLIFLGRANAQRYLISCDASRAVAEQGRGFPPWGSHALRGPEWAPIALPANAECEPRETEEIDELGKWYLALLVDRATVTLTARDLLDTVAGANGQPAANPLDAVSAQLDQALLLARDPDRRDQRKEITRLQGDVEYWRAAARLRDASAVLLDAAKQFETANQQHPRHATDAAAWSTFLRHLADELHAGPNGVVPTAAGSPVNAAVTGSTPVPVGTALPVEATEGSGSAEAPPAPDAGVPSGGVLL
jgi:hypothetical protein